MDKYYLTKERLEELKKELDYLKTEKRMEMAEKLKRAKEYGDLSENSEYAEARDGLNLVEARIYELEELLRKAVIIKKKAGSDKVEVGSKVTIKNNGNVFEYTIVGSAETNPKEGKISNESPLGSVLIGRHVGDSVSITTPSGRVIYQILKIE